MIRLENVAVRAGKFTLRGINLEVPTGGYGVLMGRTGSGKTTLLEAICGLRPVLEGKIILMDQDVAHWKPGARGIGYVPQDRVLFQTQTVWENLAFALTIRKRARQDIEHRVSELADLLGIGHLLMRKPRGLSGGEAQRVALGRALSARPDILCLDEPLSALDDETRQDMYDLLEKVSRQTQITVLHITHRLEEAQRLATQVLKLTSRGIET